MQPRNPKTFLRNTIRTLIDAAQDGKEKKTSLSGGLIIAVRQRKAGPTVYYEIELSRHAPQIVSEVELKTFTRYVPEEMIILKAPKTTNSGYILSYIRAMSFPGLFAPSNTLQ